MGAVVSALSPDPFIDWLAAMVEKPGPAKKETFRRSSAPACGINAAAALTPNPLAVKNG
jgi:hypothetical protein